MRNSSSKIDRATAISFMLDSRLFKYKRHKEAEMNAAALSIAFLIALDAAQLFRPLPAFSIEGNSPKLPSNVFGSLAFGVEATI